jgi:hypothetical protein
MFVFDKSTRKNKKYMVYVRKLDKYVHFGNPSYEQYKDRTPLKFYSHLDHLDPERRRLFKLRFEKTRHVKWSPSYFSDRYLW